MFRKLEILSYQETFPKGVVGKKVGDGAGAPEDPAKCISHLPKAVSAFTEALPKRFL